MNVHLMDKVSIFPELVWSICLRQLRLGLTALVALGILDNVEKQGKVKSLLEMEHNSAQYLHTLVESLRYKSNLSLW